MNANTSNILTGEYLLTEPVKIECFKLINIVSGV